MTTALFQLDVWDNTTLWLTPLPKAREEAQEAWVARYSQWVQWCNRAPERQWRKGDHAKGYTMPLTSTTLNYITSTYRTGVDYTVSATAQDMLNYLEVSGVVDEARAVKRWNFLFDGTPTDYDYVTPREPMMHQRIAVEAMVGAEYFALLCEMGTGKTKMIADEARIYCSKLKPGEKLRYLIACPMSLRRTAWVPTFLEDVGGCYDMSIQLIDTPADLPRLVQTNSDLQVAIVSTDRLESLCEILTLYAPDVFVLDEAHYCKNPTSSRFKAAREIAKFSRRRRILTGTPMSNNITDFWAEFEILRPGILGFATYTGFKSAFCKVKALIDPATGQPTRFDKIIGYKDVDVLKENISRCAFIVTKDQCMDLPERTYQVEEISMPESMAIPYTKMTNDFMLELEEGVGITTQYVIVQMLKLREMCAGFIKVKKTLPDGRLVDEIRPIPGADAKMKVMMARAMPVMAEGKLIIWAAFHRDIDDISAALLKAGISHTTFDGRVKEIDRPKRVDMFNLDPACRCIVAQAGAGGVGLTLNGNQAVESEKCKTSFFYTSDFNFGKRDQAEARNHRKGQTSPVLYVDFVYIDSIEESILTAIRSKRNVAELMKDVSTIKDFLLGKKPHEPNTAERRDAVRLQEPDLSAFDGAGDGALADPEVCGTYDVLPVGGAALPTDELFG